MQGLQRLQRPRWAKERQEDQSSYTNLLPVAFFYPLPHRHQCGGMLTSSLRAYLTRGHAHPKPLRSSNYNRICAAVKGVTEAPSLLPFVKATYGSEMELLGQLRL